MLAAASAHGINITPEVLVVDSRTQSLTFYQNGVLVDSFSISTAKNGIGEREGSYCTPQGLHRVKTKIGAGRNPYSIFRGREATGAVWKPGYVSESGHDDLVLTRILWLEGLEPGKNRGQDNEARLVDSYKRYIYIHGTNHEDAIGSPASRGCIRMYNDEVMALYRQVPKGSLVWIQ